MGEGSGGGSGGRRGEEGKEKEGAQRSNGFGEKSRETDCVGVRATGPGKGRVEGEGEEERGEKGWGRSNPGTGTRLQGGPHPRRNSASRWCG